jgi:DNA-binding CsgD family transcriptional regulator
VVNETLIFRLVTLIYEAAENPTLCSIALDEIDTAMNAPVKESVNIHLQRARPMFGPRQVIASRQVCSDQETLASEYYNDFLRPQRDWFHLVGGCVAAESHLLSIVHFARGRASGAFDDKEFSLLELLMPHLQRAAKLHRIFSRDNHAAACLDSVLTAVFLVSASAKVEFMNRAARSLLETNDGIGIDVDGRLMCGNRSLLTAVARASRAANGSGLSPGGFLPVRRGSGKRPYTVVVSPVRRTDPFTANPRPCAMVFVVDPDNKASSITEILRRTYSVTPAEGRLAEILAEGRNLQDACEELGILRTTAKTHLQHLFEKLGVKRQAELVAVLARIAAQLPHDTLLQPN